MFDNLMLSKKINVRIITSEVDITTWIVSMDVKITLNFHVKQFGQTVIPSAYSQDAKKLEHIHHDYCLDLTFQEYKTFCNQC